jgi:hypothetical protein
MINLKIFFVFNNPASHSLFFGGKTANPLIQVEDQANPALHSLHNPLLDPVKLACSSHL